MSKGWKKEQALILQKGYSREYQGSASSAPKKQQRNVATAKWSTTVEGGVKGRTGELIKYSASILTRRESSPRGKLCWTRKLWPQQGDLVGMRQL
eukprot:g82655.t1